MSVGDKVQSTLGSFHDIQTTAIEDFSGQDSLNPVMIDTEKTIYLNPPKRMKYEESSSVMDDASYVQQRLGKFTHLEHPAPTLSEMNRYSKEHFLKNQTHLIQMEKEAEAASQQEKIWDRSNNSEYIGDLYLAYCHEEKNGKGYPEFRSSNFEWLPPNGLKRGDVVLIYVDNNGNPEESYEVGQGVIVNMRSESIKISTENVRLNYHDSYFIFSKPSSAAVDSILDGINRIGYTNSHLVNLLLDDAKPEQPYKYLPEELCIDGGYDLKYHNKGLNSSQREAVDFTINQKELSVLHGPPGTGKTTTLVEIIFQHVQMGDKVLALAPSNLAVDNLVEKLAKAGLRVVRVGHQARVSAAAQQHTLETKLSSGISSTVAGYQDQIYKQTEYLKDCKPELVYGTRNRIKRLRASIKCAEENETEDIMRGADVVLCTLLSVNSEPFEKLSRNHFGLTVIDECSQGLEAACYPAVVMSKKLLLAGDHKQLPPTVLSTNAPHLEQSLMERIVKKFGSQVTRVLSTQYRMNSKIMKWASDVMYNEELLAGESVRDRLLVDLPNVQSNSYTKHALTMVDTSNCPGFEESFDKTNKGEAILVSAIVKKLLESNIKQQDIGIITPYNNQVRHIRKLVQVDYPDVEVQSVDGFQGREKEVIILSLVRNNTKGNIGFLAEGRRLNVAVTRAKRNMTVVCNSSTLQSNSFLNGFNSYLQENAHIISAGGMDEGRCWSHATSLMKPNLQKCAARMTAEEHGEFTIPNKMRRYMRDSFYDLLMFGANSRNYSFVESFLSSLEKYNYGKYLPNTGILATLLNEFIDSENCSQEWKSDWKELLCRTWQTDNQRPVHYCDSTSCCYLECILYNLKSDRYTYHR